MANCISDHDFIVWTANWQELENSPGTFPFFKQDEKLMLGFYFDSTDIETLFSTPGIATIKVRFGFSDDKKFKIILFGTDNVAERLTPYYTANAPDYKPVGSGPQHGNVPSALANLWREHWRTYGSKNDITSQMFMTHYGFLRGYNYSLKELIDALFNFKIMPKLYIAFVLHKYRPIAGASFTSAVDEAYVFGLLFQSIPNKTGNDPESNDNVMAADDGGYYDLSAPCPRTC